MTVTDARENVGEVKCPCVEGACQRDRAAHLARDGGDVVPGVTLRSNSGTPSSRSSRAIALDMADWTMWALRAAAVKLPVSQHVRKYSRSRMSTASC